MAHTMTPTAALAVPSCRAPILSVFMRLPFPLPTPLSWPFTPSDDIACPIPGCLRLTRPLRARPLNWAASPRAGAADDDGVLSLVPFHILCAEDLLASQTGAPLRFFPVCVQRRDAQPTAALRTHARSAVFKPFGCRTPPPKQVWVPFQQKHSSALRGSRARHPRGQV